MQLNIEITEEQKKALIYLGYSKPSLQEDLLGQCTDFLINAVGRAKQRHMRSLNVEGFESRTELPEE